MNPEEMKQSELTPSLIQEAQKPKKTWFFKRRDGTIFAAEENEASEIVYNPQKVLVNKKWQYSSFDIVGVSNGKEYARIIDDSKNETIRMQEELRVAEEEYNRFRKVEEKLVFDDVIDVNDMSEENKENRAKLLRAKEIISKLDVKINGLRSELANIQQTIMKKAFEAELKVAIDGGNKEMPVNNNAITPGATPRERAIILGRL